MNKAIDSVSYISTDTSNPAFVYSFNVDYTITISNIGEDALTIKEFINLLPTGFSYVSTSPSGDITDVPDQLHHVNTVDRQRVTWRFNPEIALPSGTSQTLTFTTTAAVARGDYWSDLLVDFRGGTFSEVRYTWPTALLSVKNVYNLTATDDEGNNQVIAAQLWVADEAGIIDTWNLQ